MTTPPGETLDAGASPERVAAVGLMCEEALATELAGVNERLPPPRPSPEGWFELLRAHLQSEAAAATLMRLRRSAEAAGCPAGALERYALCQAIGVAAPRVGALPVDPVVKRLFFDMFANIVRPKPQWHDYFTDEWRFQEMAAIATLRRFPAGQHDWETARLSRALLLRVHPLHLPGLLRTMARDLGGFAPMARIHLNYFRPNPLMVLSAEARVSYHRIVRSIALRPEIAGLLAISWFYSPDVALISPHLGWLRGFFAGEGAFFAEMHRARPDTGFLTGSSKRRKLFENGGFRPRVTMVLWRRQDALAWAARHPELADGGGRHEAHDDAAAR